MTTSNAMAAMGYGGHDDVDLWAPGWDDVGNADSMGTQSVRTLRDRLISRADLANLPEPEPLIEDTLDRNTLVVLAAPWGTGKSFVAQDWSACVDTGKNWQGREVQRGRVLYVMAEGVSGMHGRLSAWEYAWHEQITNMAVLPIAVNLTDARHRLHLLDLAAAERYDLVVIDTLARCMVGADENSAKDVGVVVDTLERLREACGGTVLAVHHTGKDRTPCADPPCSRRPPTPSTNSKAPTDS